ncbi:phosphatidate cytidylyltransferase [Paenibacillus sp. 1P07SE]|uniref:phosphatidate cytidylyltransferase n=1 Tax=Paenibacillus sp. 1P07SE TaxID=3132209 RepID=UPI0039A783C8
MRQRIVTGVFAGALFVGLALIGGWAYTAMILLLAAIGYAEFSRMIGYPWHHPVSLIGSFGMLLLVFPWSAAGWQGPDPALTLWLLMFVLLSVTVITRNRIAVDQAAMLLLGSLYIGFGFSAMIAVRLIEPHGLFYTALAFGCIWASDIGAYFCGRAFGRHKLWPAISPNKTIEGAAGGILLAVVVALVCALLAPQWIAPGQALLIGLVAAVAGQLGDLIQSAYKRVKGIKDTGNLLPGHGGVLDRCDSWLIVFPILTLTGLL